MMNESYMATIPEYNILPRARSVLITLNIPLNVSSIYFYSPHTFFDHKFPLRITIIITTYLQIDLYFALLPYNYLTFCNFCSARKVNLLGYYSFYETLCLLNAMHIQCNYNKSQQSLIYVACLIKLDI